MTTFYQIDGIPFEDYFIKKSLFSSGGLWLWGGNMWGTLGDNTNVNRSSPVQTVAGGTNWKSVSGGGSFAVAIKTDGTLWGWGLNWYGCVGDNTVTVRSSPIQVSSDTNWKLTSCGEYFTAAIKTDGTLWTWGRNNDYGQLGDNTIINRSSPVQTIAGGTNWKFVSTPRSTTIAIKTDGTLWTWGRNDFGQLGNMSIVHRSAPIQVGTNTNWKIVASSMGGSHVAAIKTDGTLWVWGNNENGQLGITTTNRRSSPVQTASGGTNWKSVSTGYQHTVAIKTDGTLWTWGQNWYGNLGTWNQSYHYSPVQTIAGGTNWKLVRCGFYHNLALKTDGTLWAWGLNDKGQLGDNTIINRSSPVQTIAGGTNWKAMSCCHTSSIVISDDL